MRHHSRRELFLLAAAQARGSGGTVRMIEPEGEARSYWTRWRGPSGQGVVEGKYPDRWSQKENVRWRVEVPGRGNSSPIVWRDRIFLTTSTDGPRRLLLCFQRGDGKLLWEYAAPDAPGERLYWKNTYASATPATDGQRVYAWFGQAGMIAVDMNGRAAWRQEFGPISLYHGSGGSPQLYQDKVIFYQDQRRDSFVAAMDVRTGAIAWKTPREERVGWGTPVAIRAGTRDEIIVSSGNRVTAYDPAGGKLLWFCNGSTFETIPTPVVGHGLVYCSSGRAGPTLAIRPGGAGDVTGSHVAWQTQRGSPFIPSPVLLGDHLYLVNDMTAIATCLDAKTGRNVWQGRLGEAAKESFSASGIAVGDRIFYTNDNGETFVLAAGGEFKLLHVNRLGERVLASPALVDGVWYMRSDKALYAIG